MKISNPNLFEIFTRIWIKRFGNNVFIDEVPGSFWKSLSDMGMDYVWLMGIWKTNKEIVDKYCFEEGLVESYSKALSDWKKEDVAGSPYAIDVYDINPVFGNLERLQNLRKILKKYNLKLILDFVPNHFSAETSLLKTHPDIFLEAGEDFFENDSYTYFRPDLLPGKIFAHGRDPFFPAWQDTIQVNYFKKEAREFMIQTLLRISEIADGVRCDMAMLDLNHVFENTWGSLLSKSGYNKPQNEFWSEAISVVKNKNKNFIFIAEAYWDLEWQLQQLGFDYTYDKRLTDRLRANYVPDIKAHLRAGEDYQKKMVRFIENHDEERAVAMFGEKRSKAAATIISTLMGMHLYFDGQFEGKKIKLPVQLNREPAEKPNNVILKFYNKLLKITKDEVFKKGSWKFIETLPAWDGNTTYENILAWLWVFERERRLIVVNFSNVKSVCRIKFNIEPDENEIELYDLLHNKSYLRNVEEITSIGLFVELKCYKSHIFKY